MRQQTGSAYLPDCRAYELVSPSNAGGTFLTPGGPDPGTATAPSRFAFVGDFGSIPGTNTVNTGGDLYLATRTDTGWVTHYIGLSGAESGCMGGSPDAYTSYVTFGNPTELQQAVLADQSLSHILDWQLGGPIRGCVLSGNGVGETDSGAAFPSDAPYLWNADGSLERRLPSGVSGSSEALNALACPKEESAGNCTSEVTASGDLKHLIFSSRTYDFAEGAQAGRGPDPCSGIRLRRQSGNWQDRAHLEAEKER